MGTKAVIYDCDGVMFDSFEANYAFYSEVLQHFGRPAPDRLDTETMRVLHTYCSKDVLHHLLEEEELVGEALGYAARLNYPKLFPLMRMEEGLLETLEALKGRVELAICTNRASSMEALLGCFGLDGYFSCVMTAARVSNPKPHPEPLLKVLEHYAIEPEEAIFVGDSDLDRRAAVSAGVPFVAYRWDTKGLARIDRHPELLTLVKG